MAHESQLTVAGPLQTYVETGEHGDGEYVRRRFCGACGSPIVSELVQTGGVIAVKAGTLDDRSDVAPTVEVCGASTASRGSNCPAWSRRSSASSPADAHRPAADIAAPDRGVETAREGGEGRDLTGVRDGGARQ